MNMIADAESAQAQVKRFRVGIDRLRVRLVQLSGLTLADVEPPAMVEPQSVGLADACAAESEPPHQLVSFVGWLRALVGHLLPWVSAETWQTCASLMQMDRERSQGRLP